ncbi:MAG TPA: four helix bundle protein [Vicinamibacterales bacterium]|nr:four helix bundle protein [Vicinamibacterales bacterium]
MLDSAGSFVVDSGTCRAIAPGMKRDDENGIDERSFRFFKAVLAYVQTIRPVPGSSGLIQQLADAAGSVGNNREEALGGSSRREFLRYNEIALRSANECVRWLRACAARRLGDPTQCAQLLDEGRQMAKILAQIVISTKRGGLD